MYTPKRKGCVQVMIYSFKVTGLERKRIIAIIADVFIEDVEYQGPPTFAYKTTSGWTIDRHSVITTPEILIDGQETLREVLDALKTAGAIAEGNLTVILLMDAHTGNTLRNLVNLIFSKQNLIQKALAHQEAIIPDSLVTTINAVPIDTLDDFSNIVNTAIDAGTIIGESSLDIDMANKTLSFSFFNASLEAQEIHAFGTFCWSLNEQAKQQKFSSTRQRESTNDRYSMRCYLLKLGFIGEEYKVARKILLARLDGDSAFRTPDAKQAAEAKRKAHTS